MGIETRRVVGRISALAVLAASLTLTTGVAAGATSTGAIKEYAIPTADSNPQRIATGPDGNLWFTEAAGNKIGRITTSGAITEFPVPTPDAGLSWIAPGP